MHNDQIFYERKQVINTNYNVLLLDIERLKKESYIDVNVEDKYIRVAAFTVQETLIEKLLGGCLFSRLKELVCTKNINRPANRLYYDLVNHYLYPIFMYGILADLSIPMTYKLRNAGNVQTVSDTLTVTGSDDINYASKHYASKRDAFLRRAIDFIRCTKEFNVCTCGHCGCCDSGLDKSYQVNFSLK